MPKPTKPQPRKDWAYYLAFSSEIVGILIGWGLAGFITDKTLETKPWGLTIALLLGVGHVLWRILRL